MATRLPVVRHQAGPNLQILGATTALDNYFSAASLVPVASVPPTESTLGVQKHTRKRYPGHAGYDVSAHDRTVQKGGTEAGSAAAPGKRFWCERPTGAGATRKTNAKQFSYIGSWKDLQAFARANNVGGNFTLRNCSGEKSLIVD